MEIELEDVHVPQLADLLPAEVVVGQVQRPQRHEPRQAVHVLDLKIQETVSLMSGFCCQSENFKGLDDLNSYWPVIVKITEDLLLYLWIFNIETYRSLNSKPIVNTQNYQTKLSIIYIFLLKDTSK